eukprot:scaffold24859_cov71-Phaeocystis_antarctica.AAC.6
MRAGYLSGASSALSTYERPVDARAWTKRRSGRLSAPVAGTPNNGRAAVRRAPDTPTTASTLNPSGDLRHGLSSTHTSRSKRPSPSPEQRPARCWPAGAPVRDRAPAAG